MKSIWIDYTNHRGERRVRCVRPSGIVYHRSDWHEGAQWLLLAEDVEKEDSREFAFTGIHGFGATRESLEGVPKIKATPFDLLWGLPNHDATPAGSA